MKIIDTLEKIQEKIEHLDYNFTSIEEQNSFEAYKADIIDSITGMIENIHNDLEHEESTENNETS